MNNGDENKAENELLEQNQNEQQPSSHKRTPAQGIVKGLATGAGAAIGGKTGANIGSKVGDVINNQGQNQQPIQSSGPALNKPKLDNQADLQNNEQPPSPSLPLDNELQEPTTSKGIKKGENDLITPSTKLPKQEKKTIGQQPTIGGKNPTKNKYANFLNKHSKHADGSNDDKKDNSEIQDKKEQNPLKKLNPLGRSRLLQNEKNSEEEPETEEEAAKKDLKQFGNVLKFAGGLLSGIMSALGAVGTFIITHIVLISIILVIALVMILISTVITLLVSFFQYGKEEDGTVCYTTPSCNQIVIISEEGDKTYSLEDYIAGAIVNYYDHDSYAVPDTDVDQNLLKAFSVIIHSDIAAYSDYDYTTETCTVNDSSRFKDIYIPNENKDGEDVDNSENGDESENTDDTTTDSSTEQTEEELEKQKKDKYYTQAKTAASSVISEVVDIYTQRVNIFYDGYISTLNTSSVTGNDYKSIIREYIKNSPDYETIKNDSVISGAIDADEDTIDDNGGEPIGIYPVCGFQKKDSNNDNIGTIVINDLCYQVVVTDNMVGKVAGHSEDYSGVYSYNQFIEGVVANETGYGWNKYPDILKAHAVAARTYFYNTVKSGSKYGSIDGNTCYFTTSTYSMGFKKNTDSAITQAVNETSGEYIMVNGQISKEARWDAFGYSSKDDNYYTLRQKGLKIPVNWIESRISKETIAYDNKHSHGAGMSQWGAAYLVIAQNKTYKDVIKFFYDADIAKVTDGYIMPINTITMITGELSVGYCASKYYHSGLDFAAPAGTPVYAATSGVIEKEYYYTYQCLPEYYDKEKTKRNPHYDDCVKGHANYADNSAGQGFKIKNDDGTYSLYFHFSKKENLHKGDRVTAGQKIGEVGTTGKSTGNHLHYEMRPTSTGKPLEPRNYLPMGGYSICHNNPNYTG